MKRWKLTYSMQLQFRPAVTNHSFTLRCLPQSDVRQTIRHCSCTVHPAAVQCGSEDSFGNRLLIGRCDAPHDCFSVLTEAEAEIAAVDLPDLRERVLLGCYRAETPLTRAGIQIQALRRSIPAAVQPWETAERCMEQLARCFCYVGGVTDAATPAEQALAGGQGVCQDYAHILLSLCRSFGLTARYVAGTIPGEGQTHAWVEVWQDGLWRGFDPTHSCCIDDRYLTLAVGRDAADCSMSRGIFQGKAAQHQRILVKMEEIL